ncbi:MAG: hypothetical protein B6I28_00560 [Fusobacteriia bacterium 4572_132]|nr:MAG: hypothetical protein B6I28_00560 [Fusobacteriia bacterium 4572_132]
MYKLSEVASMLKTEKINIIEILIEHKLELDDYIQKRSGVTLITGEGITIINSILNGDDFKITGSKEEEVKDSLVESKELKVTFSENTIDEKFNVLENNVQLKDDEIEYKESNSEKLEDYVVKMAELNELFLKMNSLKSEILSLDSEITRKNEAIINYRKILIEDIRWISMLEDKLNYKIEEFERKEEEAKKSIVKKFFNR